MSLVRWAPFDEMERLFGHFGDLASRRISFDLAVDVSEDGNQVTTEMHVPGIDPKQIEIEVDGEMLRVSGHREEKTEKSKKNFFSREIRYGSFERIIPLPKRVVSDQAKATYHDGILTVTIPIETVAKRRKINVSSN